jgi:hypothetical protein
MVNAGGSKGSREEDEKNGVPINMMLLAPRQCQLA